MVTPSLELLLIALSSCALMTGCVTASKPIDVYLIGGQSNATGQGYLRNLPADVKPDSRVLLFHSGPPHIDSGEKPLTWIPLRQASESPDRFGPEIGFGNRLQQLQSDRRIAMIKHAHSGTNLYHDWNPGASPQDTEHFGEQFREFVKTVDQGMASLRQQGYEPTICGMLWQQGENDADEAAVKAGAAEVYGRNLRHFIARMREQFNCPQMIFVYGYVLPPPNDYPGRAAVRSAERDVDQDSGSPLAVKGAFVVKTDDLSRRADDPQTPYAWDRLHFGTKGILELGYRMAEKMNAAEHSNPK